VPLNCQPTSFFAQRKKRLTWSLCCVCSCAHISNFEPSDRLPRNILIVMPVGNTISNNSLCPQRPVCWTRDLKDSETRKDYRLSSVVLRPSKSLLTNVGISWNRLPSIVPNAFPIHYTFSLPPLTSSGPDLQNSSKTRKTFKISKLPVPEKGPVNVMSLQAPKDLKEPL
jgi:hypothetical protein